MQQPRPTFRRPIAPHTMFETLLGSSGAEALPTNQQVKGESFRALDAIGVQLISEQLATGRLPVEVALLYEVPILHFREWMRMRITDDALQEIRAAAAEALQVKSMLTLSANLSTPAAASQAKSLSDRFAKIAEALAPDEWSPSKITPPSAIPSISITFNGMSLAASASSAIVDVAPGEACSLEPCGGPEDATLQGAFQSAASNLLEPFSAEEMVVDMLSRVDPYSAPFPPGSRRMSGGLDGQ